MGGVSGIIKRVANWLYIMHYSLALYSSSAAVRLGIDLELQESNQPRFTPIHNQKAAIQIHIEFESNWAPISPQSIRSLLFPLGRTLLLRPVIGSVGQQAGGGGGGVQQARTPSATDWRHQVARWTLAGNVYADCRSDRRLS